MPFKRVGESSKLTRAVGPTTHKKPQRGDWHGIAISRSVTRSRPFATEGSPMKMLSRSTIPVLLALLGAANAAQAAENSVVIVVANGPFAGTYKPDGALITCMRVKSRDLFGFGLKDFNATGKQLAEASLEVHAPDGPQAKVASAHVGFGADKMTVYDISMTPVTLERKGNGGTMKFDGTTKEGIKVHVEAVCNDVMSM
jgi:hypothetical protein